MEFAHDHPEEYAAIARLPLREQNAALREAIGYDPDAIRDRLEQEGHHCHRSLLNRSGATPPSPEPPAGAEPRPLDASAGHFYDDPQGDE